MKAAGGVKPRWAHGLLWWSLEGTSAMIAAACWPAGVGLDQRSDERGGGADDDAAGGDPAEAGGVLAAGAVAVLDGHRGAGDDHAEHADAEGDPGAPLQDGEELVGAGGLFASAGVRDLREQVQRRDGEVVKHERLPSELVRRRPAPARPGRE